MEPNNGKEVWQTIGAIVGSVSGIIAIILQLGKLTALARGILKWIRDRWSMLKQWWYWKWHSPVCSTLEKSSFQINKVTGHAEIEVKIGCKSREKIDDTEISKVINLSSRHPRAEPVALVISKLCLTPFGRIRIPPRA